MSLYIKNKIRFCTVSNLQDIFKFALEEDPTQKIRPLDFESKPDTIAHCDIHAIESSTCYKCGNEDHFIKDCPLYQNNHMQHPIPHQITNIHMYPTVGQIATTQICLHPSHKL